MIKRIWCWLTGGELVWLKDHDGEVTLAIARVNAWGERTAERHWPMKIRTVRLLEDGTVDRGEYVKFWKPANKLLPTLARYFRKRHDYSAGQRADHEEDKQR